MPKDTFTPLGINLDKDTKEFVLDEVVIALYNMGVRVDFSGYILLPTDDSNSSKIVSGTLSEIFKSNENAMISIEHNGDNPPDLVMVKSDCIVQEGNNVNLEAIHNNTSSSIIGFEHFTVGSKYIDNRLKVLQFLDEVVYKDMYLRLKVLRSIPVKQMVDIEATNNYKNPCNIVSGYTDLLKSFKASYERHYQRIQKYISNMEELANSRGIKTAVSRSNIWFVVENIDSIIVKRNNCGNMVEIPLPATNEALDIMYNIKRKYSKGSNDADAIDIGGIIYIGITGTHILSSETLNKQFKNKTYKPYRFYDVININNPFNGIKTKPQDTVDITTNLIYHNDFGEMLQYTMILKLPWLGRKYTRLLRVEFKDKQKIKDYIQNELVKIVGSASNN